LVSEEELRSNISFVIVRRLINELEQEAVAEEADGERYQMTLTVGEREEKRNEN
jgi:hypothetical protein